MADGPAVLPDESHSECINEPDRFGMFDLLLGIPQLDWSWYRRWARDYAGMSMRGVVWTAPMGVGMTGWGIKGGNNNDNSYVHMIGALMGLAYQCGHYWVDWAEPSFSKGSPAAEFIWGAAMSVAFMAFVCMKGEDDERAVNIFMESDEVRDCGELRVCAGPGYRAELPSLSCRL